MFLLCLNSRVRPPCVCQGGPYCHLSNIWRTYATPCNINIICCIKRFRLTISTLKRVMLIGFRPCANQMDSKLLDSWTPSIECMSTFLVSTSIGALRVTIGAWVSICTGFCLRCDERFVGHWNLVWKLRVVESIWACIAEGVVSNWSMNGCCLLLTLCCQSAGLLNWYWNSFNAECLLRLLPFGCWIMCSWIANATLWFAYLVVMYKPGWSCQ